MSSSFYNKKSDVLGLVYNAEMLKQEKEDESVLMSCFGEDQAKDQNLPSTSQVQLSESKSVDGGVRIKTPVSEGVNTSTSDFNSFNREYQMQNAERFLLFLEVPHSVTQ